MTLSALLVQLLNGLASASSLFLVASGLSLIFGVTRIVNFAHGSFYMLGLYLAWSLVDHLGTDAWFWPSLLLAAALIGVLGAVVEMLVLRRIYRAPELFQLLATFALVLVFKDAALWLWGPEDLLGPRAPGLSGAVTIFSHLFPSYDLFLIAAGPLVFALVWLLLHRTHWGTLVRAATQDRTMLSALGVNQAWLFTSVFALGSMLAGLGGALQLPREPASLGLDITTIADAFVVVVVGGLGSIGGAYLAALVIGVVKALCVGLGTVQWLGWEISFSSLTLVVEFLVMAIVLVVRPWGLLGRKPSMARGTGPPEAPLPHRKGPMPALVGVALVLALVALPMLTRDSPYTTVLAIDLLTAALFAVLMLSWHWPMELSLLAGPIAAVLGAMVFGWFCVRLSGVYLAMLSLAFAQIVWSIVYQWDAVTGGSNGLTGVWPAEWLGDKQTYYHLTLAMTVVAVFFMWRWIHAPFGLALRASRDSVLRAQAIGIPVKTVQWVAFVVAGGMAGLAGALYAFSKGSISPDSLGINRSIDALVMVLLGGVQTLAGPLVGAAGYTWLQDTVARSTDYWRALLGGIMLVLVLVLPGGIASIAAMSAAWLRARRGVL